MNTSLAQYSEAPSEWRTRKLKFASIVQTSNVDKHIIEGELPVKLCNYVDVYYNDVIDPDSPFMAGSVTDEEYKRFGLKEGQVIVTKDSESWDDIAVPAFVPKDMPGIVCGYHLAIISSNDKYLVGAYLSWLARSEALNDQFKLFARGVTRFGLSHHALKNALILLPSTQEQEAIAKFLDEKTAHIDALIEKKQRLLELLAEKRAAIITNAVTKGIDPEAPMKDSGIDWLGQIPEHWLVSPLKHVASYNDEVLPENTPPDFEFNYVDISSVKYGKGIVNRETIIFEEAPSRARRIIQKGDTIISTVRTYLKSIATVENDEENLIASTGFVVFRPNDVLLKEYFGHLAASSSFVGQIVAMSVGVSYPATNAYDIAQLRVPIPPVDEQKEIESHINAHLSKIDAASAKVKEVIDHLQEYRSALITEAVTGKIKVA